MICHPDVEIPSDLNGIVHTSCAALDEDALDELHRELAAVELLDDSIPTPSLKEMRKKIARDSSRRKDYYEYTDENLLERQAIFRAVAITPNPNLPPTTQKKVDRAALLRQITTARTGYPAEMLDLDADLEGDLGMDVVKQLEITTAFCRALSPETTDLPERVVLELKSAPTLRAILSGVGKWLGDEHA